MTKVFIFLSLLILSSGSYGFQHKPTGHSLETTLPLLNAVATNSPHVFLFKSDVSGNSGWNIDADLASESYRTLNANSFPYNVSMKLVLYSSETLFSEVNGCQGLQTYLCTDARLGCVPHKETKTNASYLDFNSMGYKAKVNLALDYKSWFLSSEATIANSCSNSSAVFRDAYGLIGMGIGSQAYWNQRTDSFSIAVLSNSKAKLVFGTDKSLAVENQPLAILNATEDWHLPGVSVLTIGTFSYALDDYNLIFDLNTKTISLPEPMYNAIIEKLTTYGVSSCSYSYQPTCSYYRDFKALPTIIFEYNSQKISIPPELYVMNGKMTTFQRIQLQFASTTPNPSSVYVVTPNFYNYIVLGQPFLTYYYTVFDKTSKSISLYTQKIQSSQPESPTKPNTDTNQKTDSNQNSKNSSSSSGSSFWTVPFIVIFGLCMGCCKFIGKSCLKSVVADADRGAFTPTVTSTQTILIQETVQTHIIHPPASNYDAPENYYYSPRDVPVYLNPNVQDTSYYAPTYEEPQPQTQYQQGVYNGNRYL